MRVDQRGQLGDPVLAAIVDAVRHALTDVDVVHKDAERLTKRTGCCVPTLATSPVLPVACRHRPWQVRLDDRPRANREGNARPISIQEFCTVVRWKDGEIVEENLFYDQIGFLRQIGVL